MGGLAGSDYIEFVADTQAALTEALGMVLTTPGMGPCDVLGAHTKRCKRSSMFVDDGVIKVIQVAEAEDDPAGDARPEVSCIEICWSSSRPCELLCHRASDQRSAHSRLRSRGVLRVAPLHPTRTSRTHMKSKRSKYFC